MDKEFEKLIKLVKKENVEMDESVKLILMLFYEYGKKVGKDENRIH